jgi:hypothetical protein
VELACLILEHGGEIGNRTWIDLKDKGTEVTDQPKLSSIDLRERAEAGVTGAPMVAGLICGGAFDRVRGC